MPLFVHRYFMLVCRPVTPVGAAARFAFLCVLFGTLPSVAQMPTYTQGLPTVGSPGTSPTAAASLMFIDATQFIAGTDMCGAIATACSKLGGMSPNYPNGAVIDARGFTGDKVCRAANITTMLNGCVAGAGQNGGKLLLGDVHLYADGPTANPYYTDGTSTYGTPALIIPSMFWGIEGVSRGAGDQGSKLGTYLTVCTGSTTPITACTTAFPVRSFTVNSTTVATTSGVTTMTMTVSPALSWGANIYPGELVMMKGNTVAPAENGTYKVQNGSPDTTVKVTVPAGTAGCNPPVGTCGTLFLGTPILGFGGSTTYNASSCLGAGGALCSGFGEHIKNIGFNCQAQDGCIGWQNLYAEEESGADTFVISQLNFVGVDVHNPSLGTQNFGPILNAEIYTGYQNSLCDYGTTGIYIGDAQMRGLNAWTIVQSNQAPNPPGQVCGKNPIAAILFDAPNTEVINGHCEGFNNCVLMGANNAPSSSSGTIGASSEKVSAVAGAHCNAAPCNVVHISNNYPNNTDYVIENVRKSTTSPAFTNTILDDVNGVTLSSDNFTGLYSWASAVNNSPSTSTTNILTTDPSTRNRFDAGVRTGTIESGVSANSDLAGQCTIGGLPSCSSIGFANSYTNPPICTCSDVSAIAACRVTVSNTALTITGTSGHVIDYICIGRN